MSDGDHRYLPAIARHAAHSYEYADATAREAATGFTVDDLYRLALQLDDHSLWILVDDSPVTWEAVGGGGDVTSVNGQTGVVSLNADDIDDTSTTNKFATAAELTKLAGIEAGADVTDATNVDAAGAVMNSDASAAAMSFVVDEDDMSSNSATKVPTQQSVKAYIDAAGAAGLTTEQVQDAIGSILTDTSSIDFTYDDSGNAISAAVILEWLQDTVAAMLTGGSHTNLTATYQDAGGVIDLAASGGGGGGGSVTMGAYASRPAAGNAGAVYYSTDSVIVSVDNGTVWKEYFQGRLLTPPVLGDFTSVNLGTATTDTTKGGVYFRDQVTSTDNMRIYKKSAPATPYVVTACFIINWPPVSFHSAGLVFRQSSDGKLAVLGFDVANIVSAKWTSVTSFSSSYTSIGSSTTPANRPYFWFRIADNGTNRTVSISNDGVHFYDWHTVGRTDFLTADEVGFYVKSNHASSRADLWLLSWEQT
jgi:hypothetical protein